MGEINLARVDDRLIHGQVMTKWSKGFNTNAIFVIDDMTAQDPFMKEIYMMSTASSGMTIKVFSVDEVVDYWNQQQFEKYRVILLFKTIAAVQQAVEKGLPIEKLNIGGIAKTKDAKLVIPSVGLKQEDADRLRQLEAKGIEIFFQTVPDTKAVSLKDALKGF